MAKITMGTPVSAPITPGADDTNVWPTHYAKYGAGGFEIVDTIAERDAIANDREVDKAVLVRDGDGYGTTLFFEYSKGAWNEVPLATDGVRIVDKDGSNVSGVTSIEFTNGKLVTGNDGTSTAVEIIGAGGGSGGAVSFVDGFGKKVDDVVELQIKNSLLTKDKGIDVLEIATGIEVLGNGVTGAVDGVKQLEFPQAVMTHDSQTGDTSLSFDLDFKGMGVSGKGGNSTGGVKDIQFERANVSVDSKTGKAIVTTETGVDVGAADKVFTGVERINFNDTKVEKVHDDGSLYLTPQIKFADKTPTMSDEGLNPGSYSGISNKLNVYPPFMLSSDAEDAGAVKLELGRTNFELSRSEGYLSYLGHAVTLADNIPNSNDAKGYLWFDNVTVGKNLHYIDINRPDRSIGIQETDGLDPNATEGTAFYVGVKINSSSVASVDGQVALSIVDSHNTSVALNDSNGKPLGKSITLKVGEEVGDLYLDGIIKAKGLLELKFKVESTAGDIVINSKAHGLSGVVVQELGKGDQTGLALKQWEDDTGVVPFIDSYSMPEGFITLPSIKALEDEGFTDAKTHPAKVQLHTTDGWYFYGDKPFITKTDADTLYIDGANWFSLGTVLDGERTQKLSELKGGVVIKAKVKAYQPDFWLIQAKWTGRADAPVYPIVSSYAAKGKLQYTPGWEQVTYQNISADSTGKVIDVKKTVSVPQDANNIAFLLMPQDSLAPNTGNGAGAQFGIQEMSISPVIPTTIYDVTHITGDVQQYKTLSLIDTQVGGKPQAVTVKTTPTAIPFYVKGLERFSKGNAPIKLTQKGLLFDRTGSVMCNFAAMFNVVQKISGLTYTNNGQGSVRFYAKLTSKDGVDKGVITASKRYLWLPENHGCVTPEIAFPLDVEEGDFLNFYVVTDRADVVDIVYLPGVAGDLNLVTSITLMYLSRSRRIYDMQAGPAIVNPLYN